MLRVETGGGIEIPCTLPDGAVLLFEDAAVDLWQLQNGRSLLVMRDPSSEVEARAELPSLSAKQLGVALTGGLVSAEQAALLPPGMGA